MIAFENTPADGFGFARALVAGRPRVVVVAGDHAYHLPAALGPAESLDALLPTWDAAVDEVLRWLGGPRPAPLAVREVLSPVTPRHIFQAAANYRRHVVELMVASPRPEHTGLDEDARRAVATRLMDERSASGVPSVFSGLVSSLSGPYDDVVVPRITAQCDWELELAAVIGRPARYLSRRTALESVAGYTIVNDVTMRDRVYPSGDSSRGADWLACKGAPTFLPVGPLVVPARFVADPQDLAITLRLNGDVLQDESTSDMIYDLPRLLEHTSHCARLEPGDLLLTGSPAGNGVHHGRFLRPGDVMEGRISGLGVQRTPVAGE